MCREKLSKNEDLISIKQRRVNTTFYTFSELELISYLTILFPGDK